MRMRIISINGNLKNRIDAIKKCGDNLDKNASLKKRIGCALFKTNK